MSNNTDELPILFSTPMVQAILEDRKTQTRRVIKQKQNSHDFIGGMGDDKDDPYNWGFENPEVMSHFITLPEQRCPYGKIGSKLWVRETFAFLPDGLNADEKDGRFYYKADGNLNIKWKPSIFMPRHACRILLLIKNIKIERLQNISEKDAIAEGLEINHGFIPQYRGSENLPWRHEFPCDAFKDLFCSINGEAIWNKSPFVWAIEFERVKA